MRAFDYTSPTRVDEVIELLARDGSGSTRPLAGGTDLLTLMKADIVSPEQLVNIKGLPELIGISFDPDTGLQIGGLTTLAELEYNDLVRQHYPALAEALAVAATPQLRNMATLAGNLLQRPRCWYFRNHRFHCWLKGGDDCPMREGENRFAAVLEQSPCWAVHPSDIAPVLLAYDADLQIRGPQGERRLTVAGFLQPPTEERRSETMLAPDELLLFVRVPAPAPGTRSTYRKAMDRKIWAFALAAVAAVIRFDGDQVAEARLILSGLANVPWRAREAEAELIGSSLSEATIARAAAAALASAQPLRQNRYKIPLTRALMRQALQQLAGP
ncbi:MAG: FAD binding domain-containing protein [Dehalococcoidia bacterium]